MRKIARVAESEIKKNIHQKTLGRLGFHASNFVVIYFVGVFLIMHFLCTEKEKKIRMKKWARPDISVLGGMEIVHLHRIRIASTTTIVL